MILRTCAFLCDWLNVIGPIKVLLLIKKLRPDVVLTHNLRGMGMLVPLAIRLARWTPSLGLSLSRERNSRLRWVYTTHDIQLVFPSGIALYPMMESKSDGLP